jgi:hypothetical protein
MHYALVRFLEAPPQGELRVHRGTLRKVRFFHTLPQKKSPRLTGQFLFLPNAAGQTHHNNVIFLSDTIDHFGASTAARIRT